MNEGKINVICGSNEDEASVGETLAQVAARLKDELNLPPTFDVWVTTEVEGERNDEVQKNLEYALGEDVVEIEFVKPGHGKG